MSTKFDRLKETAQEVLENRGPGKDWNTSINASVAFQLVAQPELILELIGALEKSSKCAVCITEGLAHEDTKLATIVCRKDLLTSLVTGLRKYNKKNPESQLQLQRKGWMAVSAIEAALANAEEKK